MTSIQDKTTKPKLGLLELAIRPEREKKEWMERRLVSRNRISFGST